MKNKIISLCTMFILVSSFIFAQDTKKITINIGTDTYERNMPTNLIEAQSMIISLADMYNTLNTKYNNYQKTSQDKLDDINGKVKILNTDIIDLTSQTTVLRKALDLKVSELDAALNKLGNKKFSLFGGLDVNNSFNIYGVHAGAQYNIDTTYFLQAGITDTYSLLNNNSNLYFSASFGALLF
jgi:hypothetical protein